MPPHSRRERAYRRRGGERHERFGSGVNGCLAAGEDAADRQSLIVVASPRRNGIVLVKPPRDRPSAFALSSLFPPASEAWLRTQELSVMCWQLSVRPRSISVCSMRPICPARPSDGTGHGPSSTYHIAHACPARSNRPEAGGACCCECAGFRPPALPNGRAHAPEAAQSVPTPRPTICSRSMNAHRKTVVKQNGRVWVSLFAHKGINRYTEFLESPPCKMLVHLRRLR